MTLTTFIETIKTAGQIPGRKNDIAIELHRAFGTNFSDSTIISSLKGTRSPKYDQGSINEAGFIDYFNKRTTSTWTDMQKAFGELDENGFIDRDTKDQNVFYESLLSLFYDIIRLTRVSLLNILPSIPLVFGREKELKQLSDIFVHNNYLVISGIGGIGKSYVALAYAQSLKENDNWTVQHITCENSDSLQSAIVKLQFDGLTDISKNKKNAEKMNFENRIACLKSSVKKVLIILDNLNRPFSQEDRDALKKLVICGNHVRLLITSRSKLIEDKACIVNLYPLDDDTLLNLYAYHRFVDDDDHRDYMAKHKDILMQTFSVVERHTLLITLFAKLPSRTFMNEREIYDRLISGQHIPLNGISINKDSQMIEVPKEGLVKTLFDTADMTDREKSIMRYMSIVPPAGIGIKMFEDLTKTSRQEILSLIRSNWIILDEEKMTIRLHPLICETILSFDDTKPTEENCAEFIDRVKNRFNFFNKILLCFAENVLYRAIANSGMLDYLNDYYREGISELNKAVIGCINSEPPEDDFLG